MKFELPQFIETEVKLVGPFTFKQFLWVATGASIIFLTFSLTDGSIWFYVIAIPVGGLSAALAWMKVGELTFFDYLVYAVSYFIGTKKFTYRQDKSEITDYYKNNG